VVIVIVLLLVFALLKWSENVRNLLGIRKDHVEIQKTTIELERMQSRLVAPTDAQVERYGVDQDIVSAAQRERADREHADVWTVFMDSFMNTVGVLLLFIIVMVVINFDRIVLWIRSIF
jgi:hypothetical protein